MKKKNIKVRKGVRIIGAKKTGDLSPATDLKLEFGEQPADGSAAGLLSVNTVAEEVASRANLDPAKREGHLILSYSVSDERIGEVSFGVQFEAAPGEQAQSVEGHNLHLAELNETLRGLLDQLVPESTEVEIEFAGRPCKANALGLDYDVPKAILEQGMTLAQARAHVIKLRRDRDAGHGLSRENDLP